MSKYILIAIMLVLNSSIEVFASSNQLGLCGQPKGKAVISLSRSACYGRCPSYSVMMDLDGNVEYTGKSHVLTTGAKKYQVSKEKVAELNSEFQKASFFELKDEYRLRVTDNPTYVLCYSDGKREKKVVDYRGKGVGMPEAVTKLENRVDEISNTIQYVGSDLFHF